MIGIIYVGDIFQCPFLDKYLEILKKNNKQYEIIFWDRKNKYKNVDENIKVYSQESNVNKSKVKKIRDFWHFRKFTLHHLNEKKYAKLVVLTTLSGMLIFDKLIMKYSKRYFYDIRDYSFEKNKIFYFFQSLLIRNSFCTSISSEGFKSFLPQDNYVISHNFRYEDLLYCQRNKFIKKTYGEKINIVYLGAVRQLEHIKNIIEIFKNDKRFDIFYYGDGSAYKELNTYCENMKADNVHIMGEYKNSDKSNILKNADILNNHYMLTTNIRYATANKFYDGIIFKIPQFANMGSYDGNNIEKNKIGIQLELNSSNLKTELYEYYFSIQEDEFNSNCENLIDTIEKDDYVYLKKIEEFIS